MDTYLLHLNLNLLCERMSRALRCRLSVGDVCSMLRSAGFVESPLGWLTHDLRPLMMTYVRSPGRLV